MSSTPENDDMATPTSPSSNAEDAIYSELARANLARLRGDYDVAERQCTSLLKQAPHNSTVAALLGDISAEQNKLDEALQWYEMAVDSGAASGIEEKLKAVKARVKERDAAKSEREIGLSQRTWTSPSVLIGGSVIFLMLIVCSYIAGTYRTPVKATPTQEQAPIILPSTSTNAGSAGDGSAKGSANPGDLAHANPSPSGQESVPAPAPPRAGIDAELQAGLASATGALAQVTQATWDPRSHAALLEAAVQPNEDPRVLAAQIAQGALSTWKEATAVTVRVASGGKIVFIADATREKADALARSGQPAPEGVALADALLTNEWKEGPEGVTSGR
ncbi:MAG TPA: tetratricopeptide repeat protein [Fimbriimonadaceae bacterium]|nr:tetratricopeptide repeat protein [Fimbriimonadaceae bacterium]